MLAFVIRRLLGMVLVLFVVSFFVFLVFIVVPGIAIVATVVSLNIFGDGLRDALDPRSKVKIGH